MNKPLTLKERITRYLDACPAAISGQHGHDRTFAVACALINGFGLAEEMALGFLVIYNTKCEPPWSQAELCHKIRSALGSKHVKPRGHMINGTDQAPESALEPGQNNVVFKPENPRFHLVALARLASNITDLITPEYLEARSPFTCWNRTPAGFLHELYIPGEKVVVFNVFASQGCVIWEHHGAVQNLATLNWLQSGQRRGVWFLANPVDGQYHWNEREQKQSRRSEESITAWRYAVLESDDAPAKSWLRVLVQLPLPIAAIYESGDRSVHTLVLVNARSKDEWDSVVREDLGPALVTLGICMGSLTAVRLSGLPNCVRGETGRQQRLLYLNPNPEEHPICEMPVLRDCHSPTVAEHYGSKIS
jgi:hypothetical protein